MKKERYIFDLDGTLLTCDYGTVEDEFFGKVLGEDSDRFVKNIAKLLDEYEYTHKRYEEEDLCRFLSEKTNLSFNKKIIDGWTEVMTEVPDIMEPHVIEVLEDLKRKDKSLVVLTNWFGNSQIARLKKAGLYDYFDDVFTEEYQLKPHKEAYLRAIGDYDIEKCILIGDNLHKDYIAPRSFGLDSVYYDRYEKEHNNIVKVKKLNEIIKK